MEYKHTIPLYAVDSNMTKDNTISPHYYIKILGNKPENFKVIYGEILFDKKKPYQKPIDSIQSFEAMAKVIMESFDFEKSDNLLNIYIHGIWSNKSPVWGKIEQNLSKNVLLNNQGSNKINLSIIWTSLIDYKKSIPIAFSKGKFISVFINELLLQANNKTITFNFLTHSMGNKVMQGIVETIDFKLMKPSLTINKWIMLAPDLPNNIFSEGQPLNQLANYFKNIIIYYRKNDRTLGVSSKINKDKRLGKYGMEQFQSNTNSIFSQIDVSNVNDDRGIGNKITRHNYYHCSVTVTSEIYDFIWGCD